MNDVNFLRKLQEYDANRIPETTIKKLKPYVENKDFQPAVSSDSFKSLLNYLIFLVDCGKSFQNRSLYVRLGHCHEQVCGSIQRH